jgi:hypothetical protein
MPTDTSPPFSSALNSHKADAVSFEGKESPGHSQIQGNGDAIQFWVFRGLGVARSLAPEYTCIYCCGLTG